MVLVNKFEGENKQTNKKNQKFFFLKNKKPQIRIWIFFRNNPLIHMITKNKFTFFKISFFHMN